MREMMRCSLTWRKETRTKGHPISFHILVTHLSISPSTISVNTSTTTFTMWHTSVLCGFMALAAFATAIPISSASPKRVVANSDDIAVFEYTEVVPNTKNKREDGDDRVVYTWALSESKERREDGDDQVVYSWAVPDAAD